MQIVLATSNPGKIAEIRKILRDLPVTLLSRDELPEDQRGPAWPEIEETGSSYLENALLKARAIASHTGKPALADDSGIEVDALDGAPGVRSARLAGPDATDDRNNIRLISLMFGVPLERRTARYRCVAVLAFPLGDGREDLAAVGTCEGSIAMEERGTQGFGYDPWFIPQGESRTMAELSVEEKDSISHRGRAFRGLSDELQRRLELE